MRTCRLLLALALALATACEEEPAPACQDGWVEFRDLAETPPRLAVGATLPVAVTSRGEVLAVRSSDEAVAVATLSVGGVAVETRGPGIATITVDGSCEGTGSFDVEAVAVDRVELRAVLSIEPFEDVPVELPSALVPAGVTLLPGATLLLHARNLDADGAVLAGALDPRWASSDPGVVVAPFGPVGDGRATVSWYEGHAPIAVSAGGTSFPVGFSSGEPATSLTPVNLGLRVPQGRLELSGGGDSEDVAVFPYGDGGRLLLGPDPTTPLAEIRDATVATVAAPLVLADSGLAVFEITAEGSGTTTVDFRLRDAAAALEVVVAPE